MKLTALDRVDTRWRMQFDLSSQLAVRGLTIGLVAEDGRPLGPAVVAQADGSGVVSADVRGPCTLPPGTVARVVLDLEGEPPVVHELLVDRRRGLHAWMHADARLEVGSTAEVAPLAASDARALARVFCWLSPEESAEAADCGCPPPEMADLLAECGVDVNDISADLAQHLRATSGKG